MYRVHTLPTRLTKEPVAEETSASKDVGRTGLRSVEDSLVLLQALRQSRQTWLTSAFTKFSTKSRGGKGADIWQPPHTVRFRGKCDLEIGPHVFYATSIYEVTYQPYSVPVQAPLPHNGQNPPTAGPHPLPTAAQAYSIPPHGAGASAYTPSTTALVSSLKGAVPITGDLIAQVNSAAVSNPTLANLLGLAASGAASPEQLQTLGITIQSLADVTLKSASSGTQFQSSSSSKAPSKTTSNSPVPPPTFTPSATKSSATSAVHPPVLSLRPPQAPSSNTTPQQSSAQQQFLQAMQTIQKDADVVIEFYENSYDRWTLPKDLVLYERVKRWDGNNSLADIIFSTFFPFQGSKPTFTTLAQSSELPQVTKDVIHPITLRFFNVPPAIWNLFAQAAGDEERTRRIKQAMDSDLDKAAPRVYLQHQIPDGALLTQLQASAFDKYPTKSIRPTVPAAGTTQAKRRAPPALKEGSSTGGPAQKRKRTVQAKKTESRTGTCDICKRASIVLAPDSPYCPPCTKKVGTAPAPSNGASAGGGHNAQSPTDANSTNKPTVTPHVSLATGHSKSKKQRQPVTPVTVKHPPLPAPYSATGRPPIPNYYAWAQPPYTYHPFQHPHQAGQSLPSQLPQPLATPVTSVQQPQPLAPPAAQITSVQPTQKTKGDLIAMD